MLASLLQLQDMPITAGLNLRSKRKQSVKIEIDLSTLERLFADRHICAVDLRCLDKKSKEYVKELCLKTCLNCKQGHVL